MAKDKAQKYEVVRPWNGVKAGQIIELEEVHPALRANVRKVGASATVTDDGSDLIAAAKAEAKQILDDAKVDAEKIKTEATEEAERIKKAATPPPPPTK